MNKVVDLKSSEQDVLKRNAFLSLQKALRDERYEECHYWVFYAKLCGASKKEISQILHNPSLVFSEAA